MSWKRNWHIVLHMPRGGEEGVIWATLHHGDKVYKVRFDGEPYSRWEIGDDTPMIRLHSLLKTVNISDFQNSIPQTVTSWNREWLAIYQLIEEGIQPW